MIYVMLMSKNVILFMIIHANYVNIIQIFYVCKNKIIKIYNINVFLVIINYKKMKNLLIAANLSGIMTKLFVINKQVGASKL